MEDMENFYTLKGYSLMENQRITASMEDYLEMICRLHKGGLSVRVNKLSEMLHVKPSSASKMVMNLKNAELISYEKYGVITLTKKGIHLGEYLLFRHEILNRFLCMINHSSDELKQVEKIEHFMEPRTIMNMKLFMDRQENGQPNQ